MPNRVYALSLMALLLQFWLAPVFAEEGVPAPATGTALPAASGVLSATIQAHVIGEGTQVIDASLLQGSSGLTVAPGATAVIDVSSAPNIVLSGNFVNSGSVYFASSAPNVTASFSANNINNQQTGIISTILPTGGIAGFQGALAGLNLFATHSITNAGTIQSGNLAMTTHLGDIINSGTITSTGNISMTAAAAVINQAQATISAAQNVNITSLIGNITNAGSIAALAGNINLNAASSANIANLAALNINATGGTMSALNGVINVGKCDVLSNLNIVGGDWLARELNLNAQNHVQGKVNRVDAGVNITGTSASLSNTIGDLNLASLNLSGDPIFSSAGDLSVADFQPVGKSDFIALAGGNITGSNTIIQTNGGQIYLSAGYQFTVINSGCTTCTHGVDFTVDTKQVITPAASINLGANSLLMTSHSVSSGSVLVQAPGAITVGNILTAGAGGGSTTGAPGVGFPTNDGQGSLGRAGGAVTISSNIGAIQTGYVRSYGGGGAGSNRFPSGHGGDGGAITITSNVGAINILADLNASGGGGGGRAFNPNTNGGAGGAITVTTDGAITIAGPVLAAAGGSGGGKVPGTLSLVSIGGGGGSFGGGGGGVGGGGSTFASSFTPGHGSGGGGGFYGGGGGGGSGYFAQIDGYGGPGAGGGFAGGGAGGGGGVGFLFNPPNNDPGGGGGGGGGGALGGGGGGGLAGNLGTNGAGGGGAAGNNGQSTSTGQGSGGAGGPGTPGALFGVGGYDGGGGFTGAQGGAGSTATGVAGTGGGSGGYFGQGGDGYGPDGINGGRVGTGGQGGTIVIRGASVTLNGTIGAAAGAWPGFATSAWANDSVNALGTNGSITIASTGTGTYLVDANYTQGAATYAAPIGVVTSAGDIRAGRVVVNGQLAALPATPAGTYGSVTITEGANSVNITGASSVTPAEWIAVQQVVSTGTQQLTLSQPSSTTTPGSGYATAGSFNIDRANLPTSGFNGMRLPSGVTANINTSTNYSGAFQAVAGSTINVPNANTQIATGPANLSGNVTFSGAGSQLNVSGLLTLPGQLSFSGGTSQLNIGSLQMPGGSQLTFDGTGNQINSTTFINSDGQINFTGAAPTSNSITAGAAAGTTGISGSAIYTASGKLFLTTSAGADIGSALSPLKINAPEVIVATNSTGNVYLSSARPTSNISTGSGAAGSVHDLTFNGTTGTSVVQVGQGSINATGTVNISTASGTNGSILLLGDITSTGATTLKADGSGIVLAMPRIDLPNSITIAPDGTSITKDPSGRFVWVTNESAHSVNVIDIRTNQVVATIPVSVDAKDVAFSADGTRAVILSDDSGSASNPGLTFHVVDTSNYAVLSTFNIPAEVGALKRNFGMGIALSPDGNTAYVSAFSFSGFFAGLKAVVYVVDVASGQTTNTIDTGLFASDIAITPDGSNLYVGAATLAGGRLQVISTLTQTITKTISLGGQTAGTILPNKNGSLVYIGTGADVRILETVGNTITSTIGVGGKSLSFNPTETVLYSLDGNYALSAINVATNTFLGTGAPGGLSFDPLNSSPRIAGTIGNNLLGTTGAGHTSDTNLYAYNSPSVSAPIVNVSTGTGNVYLGTRNNPVINVATTGSVELTAAGSVTVGNIGTQANPSNSIIITAVGPNSNINGNNAATLFGNSIILNTADGNIGSASAAVNLSTTHVTATAGDLNNAGKSVFLTNDQAITLDKPLSATDTFSLINTGTLTINTNINSATTPGAVVTLVANGPGASILNGANGGTLYGSTVSLTANQNIGTSTSPISTAASTLSANAGNNVFVSNNQTLTLNASSAPNQFQLSTQGDLTVAQDVSADGTNGGTIKLFTSGTTTINNGVTVSSNGTTGTGGVVLFANTTPGGDVTVVNDGTISATNTAKDSGIVAFNAGPTGTIDVSGGGSIIAGGHVGFGNLDVNLNVLNAGPVLAPSTTITGPRITVSQGTPIANVRATGTFPAPEVQPLPSSNGAGTSTGSGVASARLQVIAALQVVRTIFQNNFQREGTGVPTDTTRLGDSRYLFGSVQSDSEGNPNTFSGFAFEDGSFGAQVITALQNAGISVGSHSSSSLQLLRGNMLMIPTESVSVDTQEGTASFAAGSLAWLMETGNDVAIYNIHDNKNGDVKFRVGSQTIPILPGQQLVLTRKSGASFSEINPGNGIATRDVERIEFGNGVIGYLSDFSVMSAITKVGPLRAMMQDSSPSGRARAARLMKTVAALHTATARRGPYKSETH